MQKSFGSLEVEQRLRADRVLRKLDALIDWNGLRPLLAKLYKRDESRGGGPIPFDELKMFKAVLLGQWHSLSDAKLEEALRVRLDFMDFCGFGLSEAVPDETTLCRFRLRLIEHKRLEALLKRINEQLQGHGLMVRETKGAILDATLIASASRPRRTVIWETDESGQAVKHEDGSQPGVVEERSSADADATWLKKGKKSYYGYRGYVTVDGEDGYVHGVHTASANQSEMKHLEKALEQVSIEAERLYADKGYASAANRAMLRGRKIKSGIMHRATKNKPLSARQHKANRLISRVRYRVEQTFGTLKRLFKMDRASYRGTERVNAQLILKCIGLNLLKAANKILLECPGIGKMRPMT